MPKCLTLGPPLAMIFYVSWSEASSYLSTGGINCCVQKFCVSRDLAHTGHAYSATEKDKAKAAVLMVLGFAPYLVVTSLDIIAFLDSTLCLVFLICCL